VGGPVKRVLWISDYFPRPHDPTTGVWALESAVHIREAGVEVVVLSPTPWIPSWLALTRRLRAWASVPLEHRMKGIPVYYPKCFHYPDRRVIRWLYNPIPVLETEPVWNGCRETVRHIMERYSFQAVHANFIFPSGFIGLKIKKEYGVPLVIHERSRQRLLAAKNHRFRGQMYRAIVREADAVITPNSEMAGLIREMSARHAEVGVMRDAGSAVHGGELPPQRPRVGVVRSAGKAPVPVRSRGETPGRYKGKKVVLCVGSLIERKGQEILIRAVAEIAGEFPEGRCIIIGGGERKARLEQLARELSLTEVVEITGKRPHREVLDVMSWCDVFVLPSWDEPFGTVYAEAMAFGKPVVACAGQGIGEMLQDGIHGLLVPPRDVESLANALRTLLGNPEQAESMGREGRALVDRELNYGTLSSRLIKLYNQLQNGLSAKGSA
jgi:teichuronic acid biosynthesis glycosyltransferase TuaC